MLAATATTGTAPEPATTTSTRDLTPPIAPIPGATLSVVGIAYGAALEVRAEPTTTAAAVTALRPSRDDVIATGRARFVASDAPDALVPDLWWEIEADDATGWARSLYLAYRGRTTDDTAAVVARLGSTPTAASLDELGRLALGPFEGARVVVSDRSDTTVTVDGTGARDDSLYGFREHVVATALPGGGFRLVSAERTRFCRRGLRADLVCL